MSRRPRVLLGGVPFGCDNVGDEAILECSVSIFREVCPQSELTVSTGDPRATSEKLGVQTCPLFGFDPSCSIGGVRDVLNDHDAFVWCGATGLSDYPEIPVRILRAAQRARKKTIVWAVGMNSQLNPALYQVQPGRRRRLLSSVQALSFGTVDAVRLAEKRWEARGRQRIRRGLQAADLVVVRDPESRDQVLRCGVEREVIVGADPALQLSPAPLMETSVPEGVRATLLATDIRKIGVCVSAQRPIADRRGLIAFLDGLVEPGDRKIVFIPMNPVTDLELMRSLRSAMRHPARSALLEARLEPAAIQAIASAMDLVISSRLHLLIFAALAKVPMIGISRGTKIDSFLKPFGLKAVGSVENSDFHLLQLEVERLLKGRGEFESVCEGVLSDLEVRLRAGKERLRRVLNRA